MSNNLPRLADLHHDVQEAFKNDQLNLLLNQPPHASWVKKFPAAMGIQGEYLPIDKVDFLLKRLFGKVRIEVLMVQQIFNAVQCTVRIHYKDPLTGEWEYQDGVGAAPVQTDSGKSASDLSAIKTRAVQIAVPIAKSAAKKDAAEELGALFGANLNRKDTVMFAGAYMPEQAQQVPVQAQQVQPVQHTAPAATPAPTISINSFNPTAL